MKTNKVYARSVIFGVEDSLVSTTGLIAGLAVATTDKKIVIIGGVVAIAVEALSMGAGEYLSEDAIEETDKRRKHRQSLKSGVLMFIAYALSGLVPLLPIVLFSYPLSLYISIFSALVGLFLLGYIKGRILGTSPLRGAIKILIVGGVATMLGIVVGTLFKV